MASLKEIKIRIASIRSSQKITAAMNMVSSAKLHHAQTATEQMVAYTNQLSIIVKGLLSSDMDSDSPFLREKEVQRAAIVVCSSSTGLCGAFNANVWKELSNLLKTYEERQVETRIYAIGKKIANDLKGAGIPADTTFIETADKLTYKRATELSAQLKDLFLKGEVDEVILLYHHFKNMMSQILTTKRLLPLTLPQQEEGVTTDYILEPSAAQLQEALFPKMVDLSVYSTLLDTTTSEHAARMMAMQTANDNANDLIQELTLQYNKTRQQAITNELQDIMGGRTN